MQIKKYVKYLIFVIFILYGLNYDVFEKKFFFNEILSLVGLVLFFKYSLKKKGILIIPKSGILRLIFVFWTVCIFHFIISIFTKTNWFFYFRSSVLFYASFVFFIGFYWKDDFTTFIKKIRLLFTIIIFSLIPTAHPTPLGRFMDRYSASIFFAFFFKRNNFIISIIILILNFLYAYFYQSLTVTLIGIILFIVVNIRFYNHFRFLFISGLTAFLGLFLYLTPYFPLYKEGSTGHHLFGNLHYVYQHNRILQVDVNSSWRMVFWYRIVVEEFPQNIVGLGFGTPLLPYTEGKKTAESIHDDEHDAHTTGSHNTFITVFVRLGIVFLFIIYYLYTIILKNFYRYKQYYIQNNDIIFFIGFFAISIIGLFNPTLETPTYAGSYWFFLGLVAKSIFQRHFHHENTSNS
ncbi:MAG: hypothetical protein MUC49_07275 [Raineya sp.]|jgi:hypothetical protein|nr:hypothetical protein [Raineya sp.]